MNHLKKMFFAVAAAVVLGLFGSSSALAQCTTANITSTSPQVRLEATVELVGSVTVTCTTGNLGTTIQASVSLTLNPASTVFVSTSTTPDNMSTFPRPVVTECAAAAAAANVAAPGTCVGIGAAPTGLNIIGSGTNSITFTFTGSTGTDQVVSISGIRANINASGLTAGQALTATGVTGGAISATTNTLIIGVANTGLSTSSSGGLGGFATGFSVGPGNGTSSLPLNIAACAPTVRPPSSSTATTGTAASFTGAGYVVATQAITVGLREGFANAWNTAEIDAIGGAGTRFRIVLSGLPTGATVWAPELVNAAAAATTGSASAGTIAVTLVTGSNNDGSGGALTGAVAGQFDKMTISSGSTTIIYQVTADSAAAAEGLTIQLVIAAPVTVGVGAVTGSVGFAAVGPATTAPARPQFVAASSRTVANIAVCATYLLFPWVAYDAKGGLDTGFAIANTTADPAAIGTAAQSGAITMYFYAQNGGPNPAPVPLTPPGTGAKAGDPVTAGQTATYVLSQLTPGTAFYGYAIAVCNFQMGHGFAFINNPQPGSGGAFSQGYLAVVVTNPRIGVPITAAEFGGR